MIEIRAEGQEIWLEALGLTLEGLTPLINDAPAAVWGGTWLQPEPARWERKGSVEGGSFGSAEFGVELARESESGTWAARAWLASLPAEVALDSFGLRFDQVRGCGAFLRSGYNSWDGSAFLAPEPALAQIEAKRLPGDPEATLQGFGLAQLLPQGGPGGLVLGFERHDRFQHTFTLRRGPQGLSLSVLALWDRKDHRGIDRAETERLLLFDHPEVEEGLRAWARRAASASPTLPRCPESKPEACPPITGWASWYNLYAAINEENLREHLNGAVWASEQYGLPRGVFQIDDGFTPEMGDWLEVKPQFPRGMRSLLAEIRSAGFTPGLWIAPFMVGNRSKLYQQHPDWVVRDRQNGGPLVQMRFYGEFRWHKRSEEYYILDVTHPAAEAYIRRVVRTWSEDWGCDYFKTDFMLFGSEHGPDRAVWYTPGLTRIEIWRKMGELIREEIGERTWLGCGSPLWASIGLVDAVRIGRDTGVEWQPGTPGDLVNQAVRSFAHRILWQADPDCILLRERFHSLSVGELEALAVYMGLSGGVRTTSDHLGELSPERLALWKMILGWSGTAARYPFLSRTRLDRAPQHGVKLALEDPVVVQVKDLPGPGGALFFFNTGDQPVSRRYTVMELGLPGPLRLTAWPSGDELTVQEALEFELPPHQGRLFLGLQ